MPNNTVCLCGSTRFQENFAQANIELTNRGLSVITISMAMPRRQLDGSHEESVQKEMLDLVHMNKILRADAVFVVGTGYIGRSTAREILWAIMQGKMIVSQNEFSQVAMTPDHWDIAAKLVREGQASPQRTSMMEEWALNALTMIAREALYKLNGWLPYSQSDFDPTWTGPIEFRYKGGDVVKGELVKEREPYQTHSKVVFKIANGSCSIGDPVEWRRL